jgi:hypothetical protein
MNLGPNPGESTANNRTAPAQPQQDTSTIVSPSAETVRSIAFMILDRAVNVLAEAGCNQDNGAIPSIPKNLRHAFAKLLSEITAPTNFSEQSQETECLNGIPEKLTQLIDVLTNFLTDDSSSDNPIGRFKLTCKRLINLLQTAEGEPNITLNDILAALTFERVKIKGYHKETNPQSEVIAEPAYRVIAPLLKIVSILKGLYSELPSLVFTEAKPETIGELFGNSVSTSVSLDQKDIISYLSTRGIKIGAQVVSSGDGERHAISISMALDPNFRDYSDKIWDYIKNELCAAFGSESNRHLRAKLVETATSNLKLSVILPIATQNRLAIPSFQETTINPANPHGLVGDLRVPVTLGGSQIPLIIPSAMFLEDSPSWLGTAISSLLRFIGDGPDGIKAVQLLDDPDEEGRIEITVTRRDPPNQAKELGAPELLRRQLQEFLQDPIQGLVYPSDNIILNIPVALLNDTTEGDNEPDTDADTYDSVDADTLLADKPSALQQLGILRDVYDLSSIRISGSNTFSDPAKFCKAIELILKELSDGGLSNLEGGRASITIDGGCKEDVLGNYSDDLEFFLTDTSGGLLFIGKVREVCTYEGKLDYDIIIKKFTPDFTTKSAELIDQLYDGLSHVLKNVSFGREAALHAFLHNAGFYLSMDIISLLLEKTFKNLGVVSRELIVSELYLLLAASGEYRIKLGDADTSGGSLKLSISDGSEDLTF